MKILNALALTTALALIASWSVLAQPPGKGPGAGKGPGHGHGQGPGHGGMSDDFRGVIHTLFAEHESFERSVELTEDGYRATTTSKDPAMAKMVQKHVSQMQERLDGGMGVRHWDPAFAEMRAHYDDMAVKIENVEGGVAVSVVGKTPEAVKVAQNHAKIVSGFVEKGETQMHAKHATALGDGKVAETSKSTGKGPGACGNCQGGEGKGKGAACGQCGDASCGKGDKPCCAAKAKPADKTPSDS